MKDEVADRGSLSELEGKVVGILGGTGAQGRGLAIRWAHAGIQVVLGSRDEQRATVAADEISAIAGGRHSVRGLANADCASGADIVVVAVPYDGHQELLGELRDELAGKIVVDCVNPIGFGPKGPFPLTVPEGSAAQQAQEALPDARVVGAFHNVSAVVLADLDQSEVDSDVLVMGEAREDVAVVQALAGAIPGVRGLFGGRLHNCGQVETLTANLIAINRRYSTHAGIRITGVKVD